MESGNTNWGQSVTGVVVRDNKVLLARHTYGSGKDVPELTKKLIESALKDRDGLEYKEYTGNGKHAPCSLYCI